MNAASGSTLAVRIHCDSSMVPPSESITWGAASGTAVWSTRIMLRARVIPTSVIQAALLTRSSPPAIGASL
jgi:hypothetical protein